MRDGYVRGTKKRYMEKNEEKSGFMTKRDQGNMIKTLPYQVNIGLSTNNVVCFIIDTQKLNFVHHMTFNLNYVYPDSYEQLFIIDIYNYYKGTVFKKPVYIFTQIDGYINRQTKRWRKSENNEVE